jgi:serine/threonine protein kinase
VLGIYIKMVLYIEILNRKILLIALGYLKSVILDGLLIHRFSNLEMLFSQRQTFCGTLDYVSPEIVTG